MIKISVSIKQRMMRYEIWVSPSSLLHDVKAKNPPKHELPSLFRLGQILGIAEIFFCWFFCFGWKTQIWTHFAQFCFLCWNILWSYIKEGGRDPSGSKLHALLHFGLWVYCWQVQLNAQLLQNWWDWKSESSQPKTYKFFLYFNNNLGIEELGMMMIIIILGLIIIIIILGCGYRSLTELIRLIGGQVIIKQLPIN